MYLEGVGEFSKFHPHVSIHVSFESGQNPTRKLFFKKCTHVSIHALYVSIHHFKSIHVSIHVSIERGEKPIRKFVLEKSFHVSIHDLHVLIHAFKFSKKLHYVSIHRSHVSIHRGSWVFLKLRETEFEWGRAVLCTKTCIDNRTSSLSHFTLYWEPL